jgi:hypothetical protein
LDFGFRGGKGDKDVKKETKKTIAAILDFDEKKIHKTYTTTKVRKPFSVLSLDQLAQFDKSR